MPTAIELRGVQLAYNEHPVLEGLDLALDEGRFLGIVGPNGGGKTTLLRILLGLLKPTSGTVHVFGEEPGRISPRGLIGYLPQRKTVEAGTLPLRAIDVVSMGLYGRLGFFRNPGKKDLEQAVKILGMMGIEDLAYAAFDRLSGGQQQRVAIARAIVGNPRLLVLDEPSAAIDIAAQEDFYHLLKGLQNRLGLTIVMVSHDIAVISSYVDEIACLNRTLRYHGSPVGALTDEVLTSLYGKRVDLLMHTADCDKCARLRP